MEHWKNGKLEEWVLEFRFGPIFHHSNIPE
jgi:hypothetical protein